MVQSNFRILAFSLSNKYRVNARIDPHRMPSKYIPYESATFLHEFVDNFWSFFFKLSLLGQTKHKERQNARAADSYGIS